MIDIINFVVFTNNWSPTLIKSMLFFVNYYTTFFFEFICTIETVKLGSVDLLYPTIYIYIVNAVDAGLPHPTPTTKFFWICA